MATQMGEFFRRVTPEEAGIPSGAVIGFLRQLKENEVNIHSFCMMRGDKVFAEGYWRPFHPGYQHRMYSVGKSFVSLAVGFLQQENKLKLTDRICDYFPDKFPANGVHPFIAAMTIRDMLMMATAHSSTTYKRYDGGWVESFFAVGPSHLPGTVFAYDTSSSHVLSALVERLSGMSLMEYLKTKLTALKLSDGAHFLPDPQGVSQGGSGLVCTMEDLCKVAYVCMNGGRLGDAQLIPAQYLREATSKQIDTGSQPVIDERQGYGYQFWRSRHGGFTLYGIGGQLAVCLPEQQLLFVTTADTLADPTGVQGLYEAFWQNIFPYAEKSSGAALPNKSENQSLLDRLSHLEITPAIKGNIFSEYVKVVGGKKFVLTENPMGIEYFRLDFSRETCALEYGNQHGTFSVPFRPGALTSFRINERLPSMISAAAWVTEQTLVVQVNLVGEALGSVRTQIAFKLPYATVAMKRAADGMLKEYEGIANATME